MANVHRVISDMEWRKWTKKDAELERRGRIVQWSEKVAEVVGEIKGK